MSKLLTIVVPVYKVEPYINKCLDSCLIYKTNEQGEKMLDEDLMNQLEVIIMNDGTPDNSAEMSREYVKRYPQTFRQIDKKNGGHGSAWNVGLKEASGKYLRFLDSDDWLTNLDVLMSTLAETDADLVFTHINKYYAEKDCFEKQTVYEQYGIEKPLREFPFVDNRQFAVMNFWFSTYKRSVLDFGQNIFAERTMYDDAVLFALPAIKAKSYVCYDFIVYNYFIGRSEQSANVERVPKNIVARAKQAIYVDTFWSTHKTNDVDGNIEDGIVYYIHNNAWHVFGTIHLLKYNQASELEQKMRHILLYKSLGSKSFKRYVRFPFWMYYTLNKIRYFVGKN